MDELLKEVFAQKANELAQPMLRDMLSLSRGG